MDRRVSSTINFANDEAESCFYESDVSAVLGYIKQMLMEEDTEEKYSMFHDSLALQHTERSFYQVITHQTSSSPSSTHHHHVQSFPSFRVESPDQNVSGCSSDNSSGSYSYGSTSISSESQWSVDFNTPALPNTFTFPDTFVSHSNSSSTAQSSMNTGFGILDNTLLDSAFQEQFKRGLEQGTRFLPKHTPFVVDTDSTAFSPSFTMVPTVVIKTEAEEGVEEEHFLSVSRRRNRDQEEYEADGRIRKTSATYTDESELSELLDKVVLGTGLGKGVPSDTGLYQNDATLLTNMFDVRKSSEEVVDLRALLMLCAQAVASDSASFAKQLLKQIKQHSSPIGDDTQRLAHYFGNALEACLDGTGFQVYRVLSSKRISAKDMIKAYCAYASVCPFEKLTIIFANKAICFLSENAETVHIIDFGIRYGFKWPSLISILSKRPGGPPKLRITGIDQPQPGFRPEERVLETGRRLEHYCKRFNVPFEFNAIARKWDTIRVEDLKIEKNEFVALNCMFQLEHLLDESVVLDNPRDAVLRLIKKANPDIFVHSIVNGSHDVPFFVSRFREALFHYSALFNMLETNMDREDPTRLMFEKELFGPEIMNIVACEGCERVERPQTYKQWQLQNMRIGFRLLPLDQRIIDRMKNRLRQDGHDTNFMLEEDGGWVLQGWKGRIVHASSCWIPA
ncbi:scarecrow-like protein 14 [Vigna unguiculata]|uniref:DELLA protein n=1 Tax=Vigna unguiculata TaxID=3917 RepID=A0A4D6N656_VIGUN|nr:scarecrow-like protein 14 [Vigna unguiculata]QCE09216.1 DELLA protein [Vigna unguiculata]